ncbi:hypothetical protein V7014_25670 [Bacillus sp. JJ722]
MKNKKRFSFYDLPSTAHNILTFDGKCYDLNGIIAVERKTKERVHVAELYYQVRSVVNEKHQVIAKRRTKQDELRVI